MLPDVVDLGQLPASVPLPVAAVRAGPNADQTAKDEAEGKAGCGPVDPEDAGRKRGGA